MIGIIYFLVIVLANTVGAVSGMGGGVIIKPVLDFIGADSVAAVSFYSAVAVFTMSIVSTGRQMLSGKKINWTIIFWVSLGAVIGGVLGNVSFETLLDYFKDETFVQLTQISITIGTLIFAFLYSRFSWKQFSLSSIIWYSLCGLILGFLASLLGIGGGPINVSLLMLLFSLPIKDATVYSLCTIFFSQLAKLITIAASTGFARYDLSMLLFVVPAAVIGGLVGARLSQVLSPKKVTVVFQAVIILVIIINLYNGIRLFI